MLLVISYITGVDTFLGEETSIAHRPHEPFALGPIITRISTMKKKRWVWLRVRQDGAYLTSV